MTELERAIERLEAVERRVENFVKSCKFCEDCKPTEAKECECSTSGQEYCPLHFKPVPSDKKQHTEFGYDSDGNVVSRQVPSDKISIPRSVADYELKHNPYLGTDMKIELRNALKESDRG
jgi:hypothetical protein